MIPRLPQEIRRPDATTIAILRESRAVIAARPVDLSAAVYRHLPTFAPRTRELIAGEIRLHGERIVLELLRAVDALDTIAGLESDLQRLGAEHAVRHGVPAEHYPYLGQALVRAVRELFPASDGGMLGSAWMEVYEWLAAQMLHGAVASVPSYLPPRQRGAGPSPAYWRAYVDAEAPDPLSSDAGERVDLPQDRTEFLDRDRVELFERLARAEDVGASPDIRGQRALLPGEPTLPVAAPRPLPRPEPTVPEAATPPLDTPARAEASRAEASRAEAARAEAPRVEAPRAETAAPAETGAVTPPQFASPDPPASPQIGPAVSPQTGLPAGPPTGPIERRLSLRDLPRPGSGSPWPRRAGQGSGRPSGADASEPDVRGTDVPEPVAIGRAQPPGSPAAPTWIEPRPAQGMGTGWPPDPAIKPPRPPRPRQPDLDDPPVQA
jgi:hemoglobin-like flavoprotein